MGGRKVEDESMPDNEDSEEDLTESLEKAIDEYPDTCAVLVRRHGVWVTLSCLSEGYRT